MALGRVRALVGVALSSPAPAPRLVLSGDQLTASSSGWIAALLNLACQGHGYLYQRRWGAYWIGAAAAVGASLLGGVAIGGGTWWLNRTRPEATELTTSAAVAGVYLGLGGVGLGSAVEAGLAVNRARRRLQQSAEP